MKQILIKYTTTTYKINKLANLNHTFTFKISLYKKVFIFKEEQKNSSV